MDKQITTVAQIERPAPSRPDITRDVTRDITWQECEINAEDCRIKAEQQPSLRDLYLGQAAYWDQMMKKLV
jgi:hypothetical protein